MADTLCKSYKQDGQQCRRRLFGGEVENGRCNLHQGCYVRHVARAGEPLANQCSIYRTNHTWCPNDSIDGRHICTLHQIQFEVRRTRQEAERAESLVVDAIVNHMLQVNPRPPWHVVMDQIWADEHTRARKEAISQAYWRALRLGTWFLPRVRVVNDYIGWLRFGRIGFPPPTELPPFDAPLVNAILPPVPVVHPIRPVHGLQHIATDRQNVHTTAVSQQTNALHAKLLEKGGDNNKRTNGPKIMIAHWLITGYLPLSHLSQLAADIHRFYSVESIRTPSDWLYRRLLNAVSVVIQNAEDAETKKELCKRLFQECFESIGMCTEGHLTRLCNVFVGFDDAFVSPVPVGELIQQRMVAIVNSEASTEEKLEQARLAFEELAVPAEDRTAWLEAIADY